MRTYKRPPWVKKSVTTEEELCPDCFKVVGSQSRYKLVCILGKEPAGMAVGKLTTRLKLSQPTVTHHLQVLSSVNAVTGTDRGRERIYTLNRGAHCFEECKIPF
jgi:DNA-binding transcriptional ArsR family regulator